MTSTSKRSVLKTLAALPLGLGAWASARAATGTDGMSGTQARLERLEAQQADTDARAQITDVLHRYARGWDRLDEAALRSCFFADSTHQHGAFKGSSTDFITAGLSSTRNTKMMTHLITNISMELRGSRALTECYFLSHHLRPARQGEGWEDWLLKGRYLDRFEQRDGVWKIAHRRGLSDFSRTFAPADTSLDGLPAEQKSARKPDDPWYGMLKDFLAGAA